ncbi:MAG: hypothetical protein ACRCZ2_04940 [Fusobacteriaceae bacterium]
MKRKISSVVLFIVAIILLIFFYRGKNSEFEAGNLLVRDGEKSEKEGKPSEEFYEKALEKYKLALLSNEDINIKKNYEIVLERLKKQEDEKKQEENSEEEEKKNENKKDEQPKDSQKDKGEDKQEKQQNEESKKQEELQYMLKKLEQNEKQAFKNNETFINQGVPEQNGNRW